MSIRPSGPFDQVSIRPSGIRPSVQIPSTRLKEHINNCKSHDKLKNDFITRQESGKQLTIEETHVRLKTREENAESV